MSAWVANVDGVDAVGACDIRLLMDATVMQSRNLSTARSYNFEKVEGTATVLSDIALVEIYLICLMDVAAKVLTDDASLTWDNEYLERGLV